MTFRNIACRLTLAMAGTALTAAAYAHPGHGAPAGHSHGMFEALVLVAAVAFSIWLAGGKR
jgi:hypothetical protein